jgi:hypothetical protein
VENESFVVGQNDDEDEDEVPAPKRLRHEVVALQSSPPPQTVASSSKTQPTFSPSKTQPVASSSKTSLSKMPVPYVAVPSSEFKVSSEIFYHLFVKKVDLVRLSSASANPLLPHTSLSLSRRHRLLSRKRWFRRRPTLYAWTCCTKCHCALPAVSWLFNFQMTLLTLLLVEWVRMNAQPLPATQLVPTSFVQDGLVPALYSKVPFKCHSCIVLSKLCHSRGMNVPCEECNSSKHKCSIVASPVRFLQNLEELHPMINLGPEGASPSHLPCLFF